MHFNRSRLVRSLSALSPADAAAPGPNVPERLGHWVGVGDALVLYSALHPGKAAAPADEAFLATEVARLQQELKQIRATLDKAIRTDAVFRPAQRARSQGAESAPAHVEFEAAFETDFLPYRRACLLHQRTMATRIGAWRARVREVLAHGSPALQKLAALDAALEQALAQRERDLLSTLPALLEKRFDALQQAPASPMPHGPWLAQFRSEVQELLLAELELRLQTVEGLIATCLADPRLASQTCPTTFQG